MKNNIQKQQGTILIVSLVLLTILTLAGVSNMTSSALDLKISANGRASFNSFQAASSAISQAMGDANLDYIDNKEQTVTYRYTTGANTKGSPVVAPVVVVITQGVVLNQSEYGQSLGSNSGRFMYREIKVMGSSGNSNSIQIQGIKQRVAQRN